MGIIDDYLRRFWSFRLRRVYALSLTHSLIHVTIRFTIGHFLLVVLVFEILGSKHIGVTTLIYQNI